MTLNNAIGRSALLTQQHSPWQQRRILKIKRKRKRIIYYSAYNTASSRIWSFFEWNLRLPYNSLNLFVPVRFILNCFANLKSRIYVLNPRRIAKTTLRNFIREIPY